MGTKVTLGGDRLGSGKKMQQELHNYYRSTHNLSQKWTSPMTVGALYPFLVMPALRNDKFEIELDANAVTVPTKGPLFGSFKMQVDVFQCPIRLYQAILHNNPTNIGLKMNQVLLPTYTLTDTRNAENVLPKKLNTSCLWKYLGLSGVCGGGVYNEDNDEYTITREFNAVPMLAYYDIFKNYYANKQEDEAPIISGNTIKQAIPISTIEINGTLVNTSSTNISVSSLSNTNRLIIKGFNFDYFKYEIENAKTILTFNGANSATHTLTNKDIQELYNKTYLLKNGWDYRLIGKDKESMYIQFTPRFNATSAIKSNAQDGTKVIVNKKLVIYSFALKNIDDMRMELLSHHTLGEAYKVNEVDYGPYAFNTFEESMYPLNGLVIKTYQNDLFNNWINTEWVDGENGIAEITKIATSDGAFKLDQLNLAQKLYNMLNRVAVSGGTYEDWQDAVYDEAPHKHIESPIYLGGMSSEIVFEQIVANTAAQTSEGEQPLGDLAGRGRYVKRKGGHISVKCDEASFIIGIVSITPRVKYTQGNEFYLTELKSLDDFHKPALDGIGFQDLLAERMAWWGTIQTDENEFTRQAVGKVPAWMEYMTAVDKAFGDFADNEGKAFMSLNREYHADSEGILNDATTYIDPTMYNYAFAYSDLDAQNFWVEIQSSIKARRKMSAKQIPNL